ncbi:MAG: hypothetical protein ACLSHC_04150 [Bilophila wadsworthia]
MQHAGFLYGLLADFVDGEDDCGQQQRQQVVDDAETEEGRETACGEAVVRCRITTSSTPAPPGTWVSTTATIAIR